MSILAQRIAEHKARQDKAYYMQSIKRALAFNGFDPAIAKPLYGMGKLPACFPVPAMIGPVLLDWNSRDDYDIIVTDCDDAADPRLVLTVYRGKVYTDYPHDSPNYR